jgi:hypothetical protein
MRHILVLAMLLGVALLPAPLPPVSAQARDFSGVRILAVAPFGDDNPLTRPLAEAGARRLSELLRGGRVQVIDAGRAADALRQQGVRPVDLISPTRTVALGSALGADAVLTGRVVQIFQEFHRESGFYIEGRVVVDLRILEVGTRLILWQEEMGCAVPGTAALAMECLVRQAAARIAALTASTGPSLAARRD